MAQVLIDLFWIARRIERANRISRMNVNEHGKYCAKGGIAAYWEVTIFEGNGAVNGERSTLTC